MNEKEYRYAKIRKFELEYELTALNKAILNYKNEFDIPNFSDMTEVRDFVEYNAEEGAIFKYLDRKYRVLDTADYLKMEYGQENISEAIYNASISDLGQGGNLCLIEEVK